MQKGLHRKKKEHLFDSKKKKGVQHSKRFLPILNELIFENEFILIWKYWKGC
jgi:hypothetical protein